MQPQCETLINKLFPDIEMMQKTITKFIADTKKGEHYYCSNLTRLLKNERKQGIHSCYVSSLKSTPTNLHDELMQVRAAKFVSTRAAPKSELSTAWAKNLSTATAC